MTDAFMETQKAALVASFETVARNMKDCARMAEAFAAYVKTGTVVAESPFDSAAFFNAASAMSAATAAAATANGTKAKKETVKEKRARLAAEKEEASGGKRKRKAKDPNEPKRPPSAYIFFQNFARVNYKEKFPNMSHQNLMQEIAKAWAGMDEEQRKVYNEAAAIAKQEYLGKKKEYDALKSADADAAEKSIVVEPESSPENEQTSPVAVEEEASSSSSDSDSGSESDSSESSLEPPPKRRKADPPPPAAPAPAPAPASKEKEKKKDKKKKSQG